MVSGDVFATRTLPYVPLHPDLDPMTLRKRASFRLVVALLTLGLAGSLSILPAQAQEQVPLAPPYWTQHFQAQMTEVLTQPDPQVQADGLNTLITLMGMKTPHLDFKTLAGPVVGIFLDDQVPDEVRIMALSALDAIDSRGAYENVMEWARSKAPSSKRLRTHALVVLRTYQDRHGLS